MMLLPLYNLRIMTIKPSDATSVILLKLSRLGYRTYILISIGYDILIQNEFYKCETCYDFI
jgi:hypothetical protein